MEDEERRQEQERRKEMEDQERRQDEESEQKEPSQSPLAIAKQQEITGHRMERQDAIGFPLRKYKRY